MPEWFNGSPWPILALVFGGTGLLALLAFGLERASQRRYQRILEHGELAEATVLAARDSGWRTNGRPHIRFTLEVRRPGHPPYQATLDLQIHRPWSSIPYPPGSVVELRVDPERPERVAIVGPRPVLGGAMADIGDQPRAGVRVGNAQVFVVDGTSYQRAEDLPPEARAALGQMSELLADRDGDGLPDIFAAGAGPAGPAASLAELRRMLDQGLISPEEYEAKKAEILDRL